MKMSYNTEIVMTMEEFKKYEVPEGWKLTYFHGEERLHKEISGGLMTSYIWVRVVISKKE